MFDLVRGKAALLITACCNCMSSSDLHKLGALEKVLKISLTHPSVLTGHPEKKLQTGRRKVPETRHLNSKDS